MCFTSVCVLIQSETGGRYGGRRVRDKGWERRQNWAPVETKTRRRQRRGEQPDLN
jgi:hypothetical protein